MRCLALADALRVSGLEVAFVCRELEGNLCDLIEKNRFIVHRLLGGRLDLDQDAEQTINVLGKAWSRTDWIVVDHYGLDGSWETGVRPFVGKIMSIDDLANRRHDCDLLLDQNVLSGMDDGGYRSLVPDHCRLLLGPSYAMLRPEFANERANLRQRRGELKRILVFFGGSDPTNETSKALKGLFQVDRPDLIIDAVVGSSNPNKRQVQQLCETSANTTYHCQVNNMAELMAKADVSIGASGSASWERCCLHLPAIVTVLADNQVKIAAALASTGAVRNLGDSTGLNPSDYSTAIMSLTQSDLQQMSHTAGALADGQGSRRLAIKIVGDA